MRGVSGKDYIGDSLLFSRQEETLRDELLSWMPTSIIDVHTHANGSDAVEDLSEKALNCVYSSFPDFSLEDSNLLKQAFFGSISRQCLRFANPYKGINHRLANQYLVSNQPQGDLIALCAIPDDIGYTLDEIRSGRYVAVKSYPSFFEPSAKYVRDFFPNEILTVVELRSLPIILHLPVPLDQCIAEIVQVCDAYPRLQIILAHAGRIQTAGPGTIAALTVIKKLENIVFDTSMVTSTEVLGAILSELGAHRVLYGSDEPMNALRYVEFIHPSRGKRFVSPRRYHWLDTDMWRDYHHLAVGAVHLHWQALSALKGAVDREYAREYQNDVKALVFYGNAARMLPDFRRDGA